MPSWRAGLLYVLISLYICITSTVCIGCSTSTCTYNELSTEDAHITYNHVSLYIHRCMGRFTMFVHNIISSFEFSLLSGTARTGSTLGHQHPSRSSQDG